MTEQRGSSAGGGKAALAAVAGLVVVVAVLLAGQSTGEKTVDGLRNSVRAAVTQETASTAPQETAPGALGTRLCSRLQAAGRVVQVVVDGQTRCEGAALADATVSRLAEAGSEVAVVAADSTLVVLPVKTADTVRGSVAVRGAPEGGGTFRGLVAGLVLAAVLLAAVAGYLFGASHEGEAPPRPVSTPVRGPAQVVSDPVTVAERQQLARACIDLMDVVPSDGLRLRLADAMGKAGIREVDPRGELFDALRHKAVEVVATADQRQDNRVESTFRTGFDDHGEMIRLPEVRVYKVTAGR